jgi:hypothetical protein
LLTSMRRLLEDRKPQPVGAPPDVQSQRIETYHAWAVQAARDIVTNETERDALIATLVTIKNRQLTDVASGRRPHDAKGAVKSRNKRARRGAEGSQFT